MAVMHEEMHEGAREHDQERQRVEDVSPMPVNKESGRQSVESQHWRFRDE
jgi:hypothetical protein